MKKLTMEKLEELETKIVEWAKRWSISLKYWHIDLPGKCYVPENDESYEWDNEELKKIYGESFFFGMAIDGKIYEVLHYAEFYAEAEKEFSDLLASYGMDYDFVDATHLIGVLVNEDIIDEPAYPEEIETIIKDWQKEAESVGDKEACDFGAYCVLGAYFRFFYKGNSYVIKFPLTYKGCFAWEITMPKMKARLINLGAKDMHYERGYLY